MSKNPEIPRQKKGLLSQVIKQNTIRESETPLKITQDQQKKGLLSSVLRQKTLQQNIDEGTYSINEEKKEIDKLL